MSEFKGTQGRWSIFQKATKINGDDRVGIISSKDKKPMMVCIITENEETQSNALLISKAPEMLEMLGRCLSEFEQCKDAIWELMEYQDGWESNKDRVEEKIEKIEQLIKQATEL